MAQRIVTIEKLVFGGLGLARTDEGVIFVSEVAPGETVSIEPAGKKGGIAYARPLEILRASLDRRDPPCAHARICGGCDWLHLTHKAQLSIKGGIFTDCMQRIGRLTGLPQLESIAAQEFGYRHRAQFKIDENNNVGFFARNSNTVVSLAHCPQLVDPLNRLLLALSEDKTRISSGTRSLMAVAGDNGRVASFPLLPGLTDEHVTITVGNRSFEVAGSGFFQSNRPLLEQLGTWAGPSIGGNHCIDLYGGSGFFSMMLADRFKKGLLIESDSDLVTAAKKNFERNNIGHFRARQGMAQNLRSIATSFAVDVLFLDPPRPGLMRKVREAIAAVQPATILYVSCNPSTQARDAGFLVNQAEYKIARAAVFDLYPNTHHMEAVMILNKK